jgi:prepilin-type N-terminal cleavage/methylation domain-containing protein
MKANKQAGFTLVEVLVTIAVSAIVIATLSSVVTSFVHVAQRGRYLNLANSFVESEVEALRNGGYNSLTIGTTSLTSSLPAQLPPGSTASMTVTNPSPGIKQIDISVAYKDQGQTNSYAYTTYIGELGVGQ